MLDDTHALAAGERGLLYRCEVVSGNWQWTPVPDASKGFFAHKVTGISVVISSIAFACTEIGGVIETTDGGASWNLILPSRVDNSAGGVSRSSENAAWIVGQWSIPADHSGRAW